MCVCVCVCVCACACACACVRARVCVAYLFVLCIAIKDDFDAHLCIDFERNNQNAFLYWPLAYSLLIDNKHTERSAKIQKWQREVFAILKMQNQNMLKKVERHY